MVVLLKSEFPEYLLDSDFYNNLDDEEVSFEIDDKLYKENDEINSFEDFKVLVKIIQYFNGKYTVSLGEYYIQNPFVVIEYFCINKFRSTSKSPEMYEFFNFLYEQDIMSTDQFLCNFIISSVFNIECNTNYINYGNDKRDKFLKKYKTTYEEILNYEALKILYKSCLIIIMR